MTYLVLLLALALGYVIGLLQKGINIPHHGDKEPEEYNSSVGIEEYMKEMDNTNVEVAELWQNQKLNE